MLPEKSSYVRKSCTLKEKKTKIQRIASGFRESIQFDFSSWGRIRERVAHSAHSRKK